MRVLKAPAYPDREFTKCPIPAIKSPFLRLKSAWLTPPSIIAKLRTGLSPASSAKRWSLKRTTLRRRSRSTNGCRLGIRDREYRAAFMANTAIVRDAYGSAAIFVGSKTGQDDAPFVFIKIGDEERRMRASEW